MNINKLLQRLKLASQNPDLGIAFSNEEILQVAMALLSSIESTNKAIEDGKIKGKDAVNPVEGVDFMSREQQATIIKETLASFTGNLDNTIKAKLESLTSGVDGADAIISEELIGKIAGMAAGLIEVPDVSVAAETAITASPEAIRDALELFMEEDDMLQMESIGGLSSKLAELQTAILTQSSKPAGGVSKHTVLSLIAENAGGGTFLSLEDTPSDYTGDALKVVRVNAAADGLEFNAPTSGGNAQTGDPLSQFAATTLAQLNGVISDATLGDEGDFATAAQGSTADSAVQNTGNETVAGVKTFSSSPIIPAPSTDLQAATKKYVDDNAGGTVDVLSNVATARIIGRTTAGSGNSEELTASATRTFLNVEDGSTADQTGAQIKTAYEAEANAFTDTKNTKLSGIEASADVTDATNVQAAGALMDNEVTNLAQVKAFDSTDYASALGADDNYVTDAEKTVIGNTSGTNTGDQDLSALAPIANPTFTGEIGIGAVNVSETELGTLEGLTASTAELNKMDGVTATTAEINFVDGVTSNVQTQIDAKAPIAGATLTGTTTVDRIDYDRAVGGVTALGNLGTSEAIDWSTHTHHTGNLDNNITFTNSNSVTGQSITLYLTYSGAERVITWATTTWLDNASGAAPAEPTGAGHVLVVTFQNIGGTIYGSATGNYAVYA